MAVRLSDGDGNTAEILVARAPSVVPTLVEIIEDIVEAGTAEHVSVRDIVYAIGGAGFPPILLPPALAITTPLSGIPMLSSVMGLVILLVAWQMLLGRRSLWLPHWLLNRQVKGAIVTKSFDMLKRPAAWLDNRTDKRLVFFARRPFVIVPQLVCLCCGAVMPILEFIPFSSTIVGVSVGLLALGMLTRDGLIVLLGLIPFGVATGLVLNTPW